ncbi:phosphatase PAP2 family protein [Vannielia litorea]|uniref:phosphatase PAP2 family protein n=1 Tax=Vannielia litorea TaxID=1217970 RepID=UPI001C950C6F|nr:phosphatase PAP2 family protein [Vannielia litorea]MBY6155226.1 phosphatase PAP2 family protein [Vannielia litorea]
MFGNAIAHLRKGADEPFAASEISWFLRFAFIYMILSGIVVSFGVDLLSAATPAVGGGQKFFYFIRDVLLGIFPVVIGLFFLIGWQRIRLRGAALLKVFIACVLMQSGFTMMKSAFPMLMPFYADPFLADLDEAIHGGVPWEWAHALIGMGEGQKLFLAYTKIWGVWALLFPFLLVLVDSDKARVKRFLILFLVAWVFIGNVLALSGLSVGPIFYDRLLGGERFGGLITVLNNGGIEHTTIGMTQDALWQLYSKGKNFIGPGISAFPSVHVAVASVAALYLAERSRWLAVPGFLYLALVMFLSVYTGYHYAVDGYVSMVVVGLVWAVLKRRAMARDAAPAGAMTPAE